jgi:superfamily II DNA or RNA helicase
MNHLKSHGYTIISACPGFGKTVISINLLCSIGVKTLIVVNKLILIKQWQDSIKNFSNAKCQYVTSSTKELDKNCSVYIVNAINISKKSRKFWSCISFLIVDELHQIITKVLSQSLLYIVPNFILGLSATPYRFDDFNIAISWFFGNKIIDKKLFVKHNVEIISTGFKPSNLKYTSSGLDWNWILEQQSNNEMRNKIIVDFISKKPERTWIILVKRVLHAEKLVELFKENGRDCTTLVKSKITFDKNCKILIGTTSKIGVGFDHVDIDALCVAADVKNYFVQFLGRCMRRQDVTPIVLDFDDDFSVLQSHLKDRIKDYKKYGGSINFV